MTGLDTNVLVRYIMQDDPKQSAMATRLIEALTPQAPGFVPQVVVEELLWVLAGCYDLTRAQLGQAVHTLLRSKTLVVDRADQVAQALKSFLGGSADFADGLIERCAAHAGCKETVTFDVGASKTAGMVLIR